MHRQFAPPPQAPLQLLSATPRAIKQSFRNHSASRAREMQGQDSVLRRFEAFLNNVLRRAVIRRDVLQKLLPGARDTRSRMIEACPGRTKLVEFRRFRIARQGFDLEQRQNVENRLL